MKMGIIGCGSIASFHLPAMEKAGFKISALSGRPDGFKTVKNFALKHNVDLCYQNPFELIHSKNWDSLLICCPVKNTVEYIQAAVKYNKPILSEKPVSHDLKKIKPLTKYKNVKVAYNRRFYKNVQIGKTFIDKNGPCLIKVSIPESSYGDRYKIPNLPYNSYVNSVHIFDLVNYLAGVVKWNYVNKIINKNKYLSISAIGKTRNKHTILLDNTFNSSENFSINIIASNKRFHLCPIEIGRFYEGMKINNPSNKIPIRTYLPYLKKEYIENSNSKFKPGFLNQSKDFMNFCKGKKTKSANLKDSYEALKLVQAIADFK